MIRTRENRGSEKGEAEIMFFATVLVICGLISGALWLFGWVRQTKDSKVERHAIARMKRSEPAPFVPKLDPGEYYAKCGKTLWSALTTEVSCDILPESYREFEAMP
jgi:hypothetical protein